MPQAIVGDEKATNHGDFRLSITKALGDQLATALDKLTPAPLTEANLALLESRPGVYQLYRGEEFVYVGKADKSLPQRIHKHLRKISGRRNIAIDEMSFTCLYVDEDFSALAPEKLLIKHYKTHGKIPWNNNGFGNNDPGRRRDETVVTGNHFDVLHPIDLERTVPGLPTGSCSLSKLLKQGKAALPYNFRFETKRVDGAYKVTVDAPMEESSASDFFAVVAGALPENWQIALLPGYAIMYPDDRRDYPSAWRYYRGQMVLDVEPKVGAAEDIIEEEDSEEA